MLKEKRRITFRRLFWLVALIICVFFVVKPFLPSNDIKMVSHECYLTEYDGTIDRTVCEIRITYNKNVNSTYITVAFYDSANLLLAEESSYFYSSNNVLSSTFYIDGKVDSYKIYDHYVSEDAEVVGTIFATIWIYASIFALIMFITSLCLSCKRYVYNDNEIVVYAGHYHHYIKVNGVKFDEYNTLSSFGPIFLSCDLDDDTLLEACISTSNRITLKINNKLYKGK